MPVIISLIFDVGCFSIGYQSNGVSLMFSATERLWCFCVFDQWWWRRLAGWKVGFAAHTSGRQSTQNVAHVGKGIVPIRPMFGGRDGVKCGLRVAAKFFELIWCLPLLTTNFALAHFLYQGFFGGRLAQATDEDGVVPHCGQFAVVMVVSFRVMVGHDGVRLSSAWGDACRFACCQTFNHAWRHVDVGGQVLPLSRWALHRGFFTCRHRVMDRYEYLGWSDQTLCDMRFRRFVWQRRLNAGNYTTEAEGAEVAAVVSNVAIWVELSAS